LWGGVVENGMLLIWLNIRWSGNGVIAEAVEHAAVRDPLWIGATDKQVREQSI
jgi:hypothetical protein